jgi:hypothetical protein
MQQLSEYDAEEKWRHRYKQRTGADADDGNHCNIALGVHEVDEPTARQLADQPGNTPDRQDQADIGLVPFLRCEVDGEKGAKSSLNVRHEKREPIEAALTSCGRGRHRRGSLCTLISRNARSARCAARS